MRLQQLRPFAFVILCLFVPVLISDSGFSQDNKSYDHQAISRLAQAVLRAESVAALRPRAVVDSIGRNPFALFDFVRDEISFQAYRGVLRGAEGTLAAKAGNAWDQAVLLKTMLDYAGVPCNILRVGLDDEQARLLVDSMKPVAESSLDAFTDEEISSLGVDPDRYKTKSQQRNAALKQFLDQVIKRSSADAAAIEQAKSISVSSPDLISATRDYAWVQAEINGKPYDFHPAFPDGEQPVLLPAGVMQYVTSIPTNLFHWVRIRVFIERLTDTGLDRTAILDKRVLPAVAAGAASRIALRPQRVDEKFLRLSPAMTIGDQLLSGNSATITVVKDKPLPGSATAIWLEVTVLSPGEPPRNVTLTLADAFGEDRERLYDEAAQIQPVPLPEDAFNISAELEFVVGSVPAARWAEMLAVPVGRLAEAGTRNITVKSGGLFGLLPENPLLSSWAGLHEHVSSGSYLDAPAVAAIMYSVDQKKLLAKGKVLFSRYLIADSRKRDPHSSIASARLLEALAAQQGAISKVASKYVHYTEGEFEDWDSLSRMELVDAVDRKLQIWLPEEEKNHWWTAEPTGAMALNGNAGWAVVLPNAGGTATTENLLSGELARLVEGMPADSMTPANALQAVDLLLRHYADIAISPLAPAVSALTGK